MQDGLRERASLHAAFGSYVDPLLAERLIESGSSMFEGEELDVTVMFADVRSFTSFSERVSPAEAVQLLEPAVRCDGAGDPRARWSCEPLSGRWSAGGVRGTSAAPTSCRCGGGGGSRDPAACAGRPWRRAADRHRHQHRTGDRGHRRWGRSSGVHGDRRHRERGGSGRGPHEGDRRRHPHHRCHARALSTPRPRSTKRGEFEIRGKSNTLTLHALNPSPRTSSRST